MGRKGGWSSRDRIFAVMVVFIMVMFMYTALLSLRVHDHESPEEALSQTLAGAVANKPSHFVEGSQVTVLPEDGGIPEPEFPWPRLSIFAPVNWPRDKYKVRAIDSTWAQLADRVFYSMSYSSCEELWKDDFHPQETKDRFLCLNMTHADTYEKGVKRNIWEKSWRSWVYMLENDIEKYDFFMKTDSDSFVAVENMKTYLQYFDPEKDWYFGHTLLHEWSSDVIFNTGIGYVISRGTARRLLTKLTSMTDKCEQERSCCQMPGPNEDAHMGSCMRDLGVVPTNTIQDDGRIRFLSFRPEDHVKMYHENTWYWAMKPKHIREGPECCSQYPVVMHNYKEQDSLSIFQELTERFSEMPKRLGGPRISEYPDHGWFAYDEDQKNFKTDKQRRACSHVHTPGECD